MPAFFPIIQTLLKRANSSCFDFAFISSVKMTSRWLTSSSYLILAEFWSVQGLRSPVASQRGAMFVQVSFVISELCRILPVSAVLGKGKSQRHQIWSQIWIIVERRRHLLSDVHLKLFSIKIKQFWNNLRCHTFMLKTLSKIAWHKPNDMPTSSVTSLIVIRRLFKIIFFIASMFSFWSLERRHWYRPGLP